MGSTCAHRRVPGVVAMVLVVALALSACDSGSSSKGASGSTTSTTLPACRTKSSKTVVPKGSTKSGPVAGTVSVEPGPVSVLTGVVQADAQQPVTLAVVATHGDDKVVVPTTAAATSQSVPLLGLHPETDYDVAVTATTAAGKSETVHVPFSTGSLPKDLPPVRTTVSQPTKLAPGFTLLNTMPWGQGANAKCTPYDSPYNGWIIGVNDNGDVVWYYRSKLGIADVSPTKQGTLLVSVNDVVIREIDMLGNTLKELGTRVATDYVKTDVAGTTYAGPDTKPIDIDSAHHELTQMPNGDLMTISTEIVTLDSTKAKGMCKGVKDTNGKPVSDPTAVVADIVTELTPAGDVVKQWHLKDYFDPYTQPGSDMCVPTNPIAPPNWFYPGRPGLRDWMHTNAAVLDPVTNTIDVSIRHLDTVLGIRYADDAAGAAGTAAWKLSPKGGTLDLTSGTSAYHGHAIEPDADNRLLYYDNGNGRPGTQAGGGKKPAYSRAVMYEIDRAAGTAKQIWEHRDDAPGGAPIFTPFLGDADLLANGNVLITYGGASTPKGVYYARFIEVVPGTNGAKDQVVFDMTLGNQKTDGYTAYRSDSRAHPLLRGRRPLPPTGRAHRVEASGTIDSPRPVVRGRSSSGTRSWCS